MIEDDVVGGKRHVRFIPGPVFANIILADEINRTPPRTQAALLEAMQEYQVTVGGVRYALERPLFVLATENPIEQEGTYPLPEAQLDRFMFNVVIDYPDAADERRILAETTTSADRAAQHVTTGAELEAARMLVRELPAAANVVDYALRLIRATRPDDPTAPQPVREWVRWGVGPRAGQALLLGAKACGAARRPHRARARRRDARRASGAAPSPARELSGGGGRHHAGRRDREAARRGAAVSA